MTLAHAPSQERVVLSAENRVETDDGIQFNYAFVSPWVDDEGASVVIGLGEEWDMLLTTDEAIQFVRAIESVIGELAPQRNEGVA